MTYYKYNRFVTPRVKRLVVFAAISLPGERWSFVAKEQGAEQNSWFSPLDSVVCLPALNIFRPGVLGPNPGEGWGPTIPKINNMFCLQLSRPLPTLIWLLALVLMGQLAACSQEKTTDTLLSIPNLSPELARHLIADDDSTFARYCREAGAVVLMHGRNSLCRYRREGVDGDYARRDALVFPHWARIDRCLKEIYEIESSRSGFDIWVAMSVAERKNLDRRLLTYHALSKNETLPAELKERRLLESLDNIQESEPFISRAQVLDDLSGVMLVLDRFADHRSYLEQAIAAARIDQGLMHLSHMLGVLGCLHQSASDVDSMRICWDEALDIANRHRLAGKAARIHIFYFGHFLHRGQLALAKKHLDQAMEVCREFKGKFYELRVLMNLMKLHMDLKCWNLVQRDLERIEVLEGELQRSAMQAVAEDYLRKIRRLKAHYLISVGRQEEGLRIHSALAAMDWSHHSRADRARTLGTWGADLVDLENFQEAISVLEEGVALCREKTMPELEVRFWCPLAQAHLSLGNRQAGQMALAEFRLLAATENRLLTMQWLKHDVLNIELQGKIGQPADVALSVVQATERLQGFLLSLDADLEGDLLLAEADDLRFLLHDLVQDDPRTGYQLELLWRQALSRRSAGANVDYLPMSACGNLVSCFLRDEAGCEEAAREIGQQFAELDALRAIHLSYLMRPEEITLFVASANGVSRAVLAAGTREITNRVKAALADLTADPDDPEALIPRKLQEELQQLGRILLPPEILPLVEADRSAKPLLLISAGGILRRLPFAALSVAQDEYRPLLLSLDVAYLRSAILAPVVQPTSAPGLILANPVPAAELVRWLGPFPDLSQGMAEAQFLHDLRPDARFFRREEATKTALLANWEQASFIHLASHVVRDPELPYLILIPLSPGDGDARFEATILEVSDIRKARLHECELVVLASCGSGAPYLTGESASPSLAEAFADAGAGSVVQTFWKVRDEDARQLMNRFWRAWAVEGKSPIKALGDARRETIRQGDEIRHPFSWATYSLLFQRRAED